MSAVVPVEVVGGKILAADYNFLVGGSANQRPTFQAVQTAVQSVPNAAFTAAVFGSATRDTDSGLTIASGLYTIQTAGFWIITATVHWASNNTGFRGVALTGSNGLEAVNFMSATPDGAGRCAVTLEGIFAATNTITCFLFQSSTAALNTSGDTHTMMSGVWIGS